LPQAVGLFWGPRAFFYAPKKPKKSSEIEQGNKKSGSNALAIAPLIAAWGMSR
jgi:hypothetical protein